MRKQVAKRTVRSYRDVLRERERQAVREEYAGGAYGCPGEYFRGAPQEDCREGFRRRCRSCWNTAYADEEWIPSEKRDG